MTIICNPPLTQDQYKDNRWTVILWTEESGKLKKTPYIDSKGYVTIGAGFKIDSNLRGILEAFGFNIKPEASKAEKNYIQEITNLIGTNRIFTSASLNTLITSLNNIMARRARDTAVPGTNKRSFFAFNDNNEIKATFEKIVKKYEDQLTSWLGGISCIQQYSYERIALLSFTYNNLIGFKKGKQGLTRKSVKLWNAISNGNRAEAWFQIRYDSNGGSSRGPGIAKRRYYESELFGLYNDPQNVTLDDAKQVYRMLENHRSKIIREESLFGIAMSDGVTRGTWQYNGKTALEMANDYPSMFEDGKVDSLESSLKQAYHQIFIWLQEQYPSIMAGKTESNFKSYNVLLDEADSSLNPNHAAILDARLLKSGIEQDIDNILIGEGGDDILIGGKGNDIMIGGTGYDTYIYNIGDGNDTIIDEDNKGKIIIRKSNGQEIKSMDVGNLYAVPGLNVWRNPNNTITISHNSPWKVSLEDGGTIELGENFQSGDFGINLINLPDALKALAQTDKTTIKGDFKPIDFDPSQEGIQAHTDEWGNEPVEKLNFACIEFPVGPVFSGCRFYCFVYDF